MDILTTVSATLSTGANLLFYVLMLIFVVYSVFLAFHWFSYGTDKLTSLLTLAIYLGGGAVFFLAMSVALLQM